jgi:hypothetical protein
VAHFYASSGAAAAAVAAVAAVAAAAEAEVVIHRSCGGGGERVRVTSLLKRSISRDCRDDALLQRFFCFLFIFYYHNDNLFSIIPSS